MINCDEHAIKINQNLIGRLILDDPKVSKALLFNLRNENGVVEIEKLKFPDKSRKRWEDLTVFKDEYLNQPEENNEREKCKAYFDYFNSIILLLSDLCLDRNQEAILYLE